jgi:hypothetical protein
MVSGDPVKPEPSQDIEEHKGFFATLINNIFDFFDKRGSSNTDGFSNK